MARCSSAGMVGAVFAISGKPTGGREHQESKASYFQPELMGYPGEMLERGTSPAHHCAERPAALYVLPGDPGSDAQFTGG